MPSWLVPLIILIGFACVFTIVLWDDLKPSTKVRTVRALALPDEQAGDPVGRKKDAPARLLFQAAGWLEPEPTETKAGVLINGTIDKLLVNEGELVRKGDKLATLVDREYQIAVGQTHAAHREAEAAIRLREAEIKTAQAHLNTEAATLAASKERLKKSRISYERYAALKPGTVSVQTITDAEQELREQEQITLSNESKLVASEMALEEARVRLDSSIAAEQNAEQACRKAALDLERCTVPSPIDGRILRLHTSPGARVNAQADDPVAGLVATLYDPQMIALKMDVPLDQAGKLAVGQQARIRCEVFPDRIFLGKVTRIAGEADIQRNTLQARVLITNPDDKLRPGMACRAEIFTDGVMPAEGEQLAPAEEGASRQAVLIPAEAIVSADGGSSRVWVVSVSDKLEQRDIRLDSSKDRDGLKAVTFGILPGEPVVINPENGLSEGATAESIN